MKIIELNELHKIQLDILLDFSKFCEENDINYTIAYGSLIGAVRHKGFIPWDDDIDVVVPRQDYMKLVEIFNNRDSIYKLSSIYNNPDYPYCQIKIQDTRTILIENNWRKIGINIDIFPLEGLPSTKIIQYIHLSSCKILRHIIGYKKLIIKNQIKTSKKISLFIIKLLLSQFTLNYFINLLDKLARKYSYVNSKYVANLVWGTYDFKEKFDKELFESFDKMEFEGNIFMVPADYKKILTQIYGDYMKLPPENTQKSHHHFEAYWKE